MSPIDLAGVLVDWSRSQSMRVLGSLVTTQFEAWMSSIISTTFFLVFWPFRSEKERGNAPRRQLKGTANLQGEVNPSDNS